MNDLARLKAWQAEKAPREYKKYLRDKNHRRWVNLVKSGMCVYCRDERQRKGRKSCQGCADVKTEKNREWRLSRGSP